MSDEFSKFKDRRQSILNPENVERTVHYDIERKYLIMRDGGACYYCKTKVIVPQPDHVIPWNRHQRTHMDNLVSSCKPCNDDKGGDLFEEHKALEILLDVFDRNDKYFPYEEYFENRVLYFEVLEEILLGI